MRTISLARVILLHGVLALGAALSPCAIGVTTIDRSAPSLTGTVWAWQATSQADGRQVESRDPKRYTIELAPDGSVRVQADCNRGGGHYTLSDDRLTFGPIATTKKGCPAGSRDRVFLDGLRKGTAWRLASGELLLALDIAGAVMRFEPVVR